jgi:hypothetical protein
MIPILSVKSKDLAAAPSDFRFRVRILEDNGKIGTFTTTVYQSKGLAEAWLKVTKKLKDMKVLHQVVDIARDGT